MKEFSSFFISLLVMASSGFATPDSTSTATSDSLAYLALLNRIDSLPYQTGKVTVANGIATIDVPTNLRFYGTKEAQVILHNLWGNPEDLGTLGMLVPNDLPPYTDGAWAVEVTYSDDGHVKDDDAKDIKYNELMESMKKETEEANEARIEQGSRAIELTGWAEQPYYDAKTHKLFWAKKIKAKGSDYESLNYNIRILGRKGVLVLNAISGLVQLPLIKQQTPAILAATNFTKGNRYEDFDSSIDNVAAYGIGGLIAGGILMKTGLFAKLGLVLLKFSKVILVGGAALVGGIVKFFKGKTNNNEDAI